MNRIIEYCNGKRTYQEIANLSGLHRNTVYRLVNHYNLQKNLQGCPKGKLIGKDNPRYRGGRHILPNGYVMVLAPYDYPNRPKTGYVAEHRLVMEKKLGRYLLPNEVVDHIDGLRLHNSPENLRLYDKNGDHLRVSLAGKKKKWSKEGMEKLKKSRLQPLTGQPVNKYLEKIKSGDYLLQQILLAALKLGIDSPYLLGTHRHLEKIGIDWSDRCNLELALNNLSERFLADLNL